MTAEGASSADREGEQRCEIDCERRSEDEDRLWTFWRGIRRKNSIWTVMEQSYAGNRFGYRCKISWCEIGNMLMFGRVEDVEKVGMIHNLDTLQYPCA